VNSGNIIKMIQDNHLNYLSFSLIFQLSRLNIKHKFLMNCRQPAIVLLFLPMSQWSVKMKDLWCLVLGGGGGKGAYQIGVWKALRELDFRFEAIIGTSVGALNGALISMDRFDAALELWENISTDQVLNLPAELLTAGNLDISKLNLKTLKQLQNRVVQNGGFDTTPLRTLMGRVIDEEKLRKSGIDYGLVTFDALSMKPVEAFIDRIPSGKLIDYLMASSALPGFQFTRVKNKIYLDGGLHDNIPFNLAKYRGYRKLLVIDVAGIGVNKKPDLPHTQLIYLKPSQEIGNILDFSSETARKNIRLGYLDTLRTAGVCDGIQYCYRTSDKMIRELEGILFSEACLSGIRSLFHPDELRAEPLENGDAIRKYLPEKFRENRHLVIPMLEASALILNVETLSLYSLEDLAQSVFNRFEEIRSRKKASELKEVIHQMMPDHLTDLLDDFKRYQIIDDLIFDPEFLKFAQQVKKVFPMLIPLRILQRVLELYYQKS
jgi:NTE family protein